MTTVRGRARALLVGALTVLALAGCVAIPTSGPVQEGHSEVVEPAGIVALAEGPRPGAKPVELVESFLINAPLDFREQFAVGRLYLAGEASDSWNPLAGVVVAGSPAITAIGDSTVQVDVPVVARVDADGRYSESAAGARESMTFQLVQDDEGQWRISSAPPGLIVSELDFASLFRATSLYFLSPDSQYLVPEVRWLPAWNLATSAVRALLAGPSPWLRDAVRTAVPEGVQLKPQSVTVDDSGVATVGLDAARASAVLDADRPLLLAQIEATLRQVPEVGKVQLQVGGVPLDADEGAATLQRAAPPGGAVEMLQAGRLVQLGTNDVVPVQGVAPLTDLDPRSPARNDDGSVRVLLSGSGALVTMPTGETPAETLLTGANLAAPSVDRFGWAWTGDAAGELLAGKAGEQAVRLSPEWAEGRALTAVRVSRDGARVAVVSHGADGVAVEVVAVNRDASGIPQRVGAPVRVGVPLVDASAVVWLDESTLGVLGSSAGTTALHLVPVAGPTEALPEVVGDLVDVAGGKVPYVSTADGELWRLVGQSSWVRVPGVEGVSDPSYPG
ncbi:lipoprotein LpqB [Cellulomonas chitinilytica]|uniref:Lipoprotein LpqB n=1 Tax=Cellulomonas chitinilytica TaxID=398759 RepID=A0A919NZ02_9CELL|nr:LpqB family beta-propeller domain-containing protein [Cellulomonas chitinilytica]GIG20142.1 lipoprotein LpqB [Cellulomonas chitinilytica]